MTERLHFTFHFHALEKEMATHSSVLARRIPGTREPGGLPSMGSHRVGHDWSDLAAAAAGMVYCLWTLAQDSKRNVNKYLLYKVGGSDRVEHNYSTEGLKVLFCIRLGSLLRQFNAIFHFQSFPSPFGDGKELLKTTLKFSFFVYVPNCKWCNILRSPGLALRSLFWV